MTQTTGRCLCGAVTFAFTGKANWCGHCHCESCRRATGSPFTTFIGVDYDKFRYTGAEPKRRQSSEGVHRSFCGACGTPIAYESARFAHEIHLYVATLDHPEAMTPTFHVHCADKLPWIDLADGLPQHAGFTT